MTDRDSVIAVEVAIVASGDAIDCRHLTGEQHDDAVLAVLAALDRSDPRLIAACPDCGDEFDVTDGEQRTFDHYQRHHADGSDPASHKSSKRSGGASSRRT